MTSSPAVSHLFAGVAVVDYPSGRAWYERLFGRPPDAEPATNEAMWHVVGTGSV